MPTVAVVILNWNGKRLLEKFLPSVVKHSSCAEVWIADNNSTDDSVDFVKQYYPQIKITINKINGGFAKGYNDSLARIKADYFVLLNSDVEVTANWIEPVIEQMNSDKQVAACQPKILAYNQKKMFEYAGAAGGFLDKWNYPFCRGRLFDTLEEDEGQYNRNSEIFWASGAALFVRSSAFFEVGGFDEAFFSHMEEIDLCWRLKNRAYKIMYIASSCVYHVGGATLSAYNPKKTYLNFRNNLYLITKNQFKGSLWFTILVRLCFDGLSGVKFILDKKPQHTLAIIKAHFHFYKKLSYLLPKRKQEKIALKTKRLSGVYKGWVVADYFLKGIKKFSDLPENKFI
ncbi:MAG: glycosyltransferase family 2 protein [Bacteroidia bacterium]|nr:glycosyltransferase family 2 protein [Bacteroidia bacterium]